VTNKLEKLRTAFDALSDVDKEALQVGGRILGQSLLFGLTKTLIVHAIGRKIAPNVFKNLGRTIALVSLIEAATGRYKVSDEDKKTVARIKEQQADQKLEEIRRFGV
jgi:hypothetical protein